VCTVSYKGADERVVVVVVVGERAARLPEA
jgi:hypothetical protein